MNIAVTGANGFIAKNFIFSLHENKKFKVYKITRKSSKKEIKQILNESDLIYHFAGVNRSSSYKTFLNDNIRFTKFICDFLKKKKIRTPIIFSSSIQANSKNHYGISKKKTEKLLIDLKDKNQNNVFILRLPNIFGKWSKPNYNSVVSTFCYNISRGKKTLVSNPKKSISLLYIDDLVIKLKKYIKSQNNKNVIFNIKPTNKIKLIELQKTIKKFEINRNENVVSNFANKFVRNLYSTYVSFLPKKKFLYPITKNIDPRGSFVEFLKSKNFGQISFFIAKKGKIRGHHFHHSKVEKFLVIKGSALFTTFDISKKKFFYYNLNDKNLKVIESIPGHQHFIKNNGKNDLVVLLWSHEIFDKNKPDTFKI